VILSNKWVEKSGVVIFFRLIPAITDLITCISTAAPEFIGRFDIENQIAMDGDLSNRVLKYLEELGYKKSSKG
jgi:hypothetical protein